MTVTKRHGDLINRHRTNVCSARRAVRLRRVEHARACRRFRPNAPRRAGAHARPRARTSLRRSRDQGPAQHPSLPNAPRLIQGLTRVPLRRGDLSSGNLVTPHSSRPPEVTACPGRPSDVPTPPVPRSAPTCVGGLETSRSSVPHKHLRGVVRVLRRPGRPFCARSY
jgi:hypothetical protein